MSVSAPHGERDALLAKARSLRAGRRPTEALSILAELEALVPNFSRLHHERGHCHVVLGDAAAAITSLREAVRLNPTMPASWDMLEQLYRMVGDPAAAQAAAAQVTLLKSLPPEVIVANSLFADSDLAPAEAVLRDYLNKDQGNVGALRLLARIRGDLEDYAEAQDLLERVLERAPDYHAARLDYALVLLQRQKHRQARDEAQRLLAHDPNNREYLKQYAAACIGLGDYEPVIGLYEDLLTAADLDLAEVAELRLWRANALKVTGRREEAIADYRAALEGRDDYGVAWFSLANLKTYRFSEDEIAKMRALEARNDLRDLDRVYLCFALGKALEDEADYPSSWFYYERGNAVRRLASRYRPDTSEACAARLKQVLQAEFFADRAGWGATDPAPIFVLGLPRSGSTLIEQILVSHSQVEGTHELTEIDRIAAELCGRDLDCGLPFNFEPLLRLTQSQVKGLGERFLAETRVHRRLGRPFFIDKMPNNFWHVGLIHLILPGSTIIDVRREPMACCFSNFKQLFGTANQEFTYGIEDMARYYRVYLDIMRHWELVLPGRVIKVRYEDVVEDLDGAVRRMLSRCRLSFEPACLAFHETRRSIRTPSSEQVRQPIGREGVDQWRNYETWLAPLQEILGDAIESHRS